GPIGCRSAMRQRLRSIETRVLPHSWRDLICQVLLFAGAYAVYELVRGFADGNPAKAAWNATKIINLERVLHVFVEPSIQSWVSARHWLIDIADWTYLNDHYMVTLGVLVFLYLRRN